MSWLYEKHVVIEGDPMIWEKVDISNSQCPHCRRRIDKLDSRSNFAGLTNGGAYEHAEVALGACPTCGWWLITVLDGIRGGSVDMDSYSHLHSVLETCDVSTVDGPADELQRYLLHNYGQRFEVRPYAFEDVVGQVFRNHGFHVESTARSNDGGIDLFVAEKSGSRRAVQVKRYADKIEAALIREFAGALVLEGNLEGIFVTTSAFSKGAVGTAERYQALNTPTKIELWDAERFFSAMSFRRGRVYDSAEDESAPFSPTWAEVLHRYSGTWIKHG